MATATLVLRSVSRPRRCAYCHDGLGVGVACAGCGVRMHPGCWRALRRCPSLGCAGVAQKRRRPEFSWGSALPLILLSLLALAPLPAFVLGRCLAEPGLAQVPAPPYAAELAWRPEEELLRLREEALELLRTHPEGPLSPEQLEQLPEAIKRYAPEVVVVRQRRVEIYLPHGVVTVGSTWESAQPLRVPNDAQFLRPAEQLLPCLWWERRR